MITINTIQLSLTLVILIEFKILVNGLKIYESKGINENSTIINNLKIIIERNQSYNLFPEEFQISINKLGYKLKVHFKKALKNNSSYPIKSSNIFIIDDKTGNLKKYDLPVENKYEFYSEINGNGFGELVKNEDFDKKLYPFKLVATIFNSRNIFDITPIKVKSNRKREVKENLNDHLITKRDASEPNSSFDAKESLSYKILKIKKQKKLNRKKRTLNGEPVQLYVETLIVTDYSVYNDHQRITKSTDQNVVFQHMKLYFSHVINGVNSRYQNSLAIDPDLKINIKLTNFLFLTNLKDCEWANPAVVGDRNYFTYDGREIILANSAYSKFVSYLNSKNLPFSYDHAIGLFNKDLWLDDTTILPSLRTTAAGFSKIGGICTSERYSISEEKGGFANINTIAHEIGHNLGASHDGTDKAFSCPGMNNYLMAPIPSINQFTLSNIFKFSSCSIESFKNTLLDNYSEVSPLAQCLKNEPTEFPAEIIYSNFNYPGQLFSPDDQCKMIYGETASFCKYASSSVCSLLVCRKSENDTDCIFYPGGAAEGTTCDSGKICIQGVCTSNENAPTGECLYGNDVVTKHSVGFNLPYPQMNCESALEYISNQLFLSPDAFCSDPNFKKTCCVSCLKYNAMSCQDKYIKCPSYANFCSTGYQNGIAIRNLCPRTCGTCSFKTVDCSNSSFICQNGGTCVNKFLPYTNYFAFECKCPVGFVGELCEIKDPCQSNPCLNGGVCEKLGSLGYTCLCPIFCYEYNCSVCIQPFNSTTSSSSSTTITQTTESTNTTISQLTDISTSQSILTTMISFNSTLLSTFQAQTNTTTSSNLIKNCQNIDDYVCNYFAQTGLCALDNAYLYGVSFKGVCAKACNLCGDLVITITTTTTSMPISTNPPCVDSQRVCQYWANYCSLLQYQNPHPCKYTCKLC